MDTTRLYTINEVVTKLIEHFLCDDQLLESEAKFVKS